MWYSAWRSVFGALLLVACAVAPVRGTALKQAAQTGLLQAESKRATSIDLGRLYVRHRGHPDPHQEEHDPHHDHGGHGTEAAGGHTTDHAATGAHEEHDHSPDHHGGEAAADHGAHGEHDHSSDHHGGAHDEHDHSSDHHGGAHDEHDHSSDHHGGAHDEHDHSSDHRGGESGHAADDHHGHSEAVRSGHHASGHHGHAEINDGHGEHGDGSHGKSEYHKLGHSHGAHSVAIGLVASVVIIPMVVSMSLKPGKVQEFTIKMLDTFISIFLAVLWFNTFRQFMVTMRVGQLFPYAHEFFSLVQIIVLYGIANFIAWVWRDHDMRLTTFCSCGAHFIAFAGINFAGGATHTAAQYSGEYYDVFSVWGLALAMGAFLGVMYVVNYFSWRKHTDHDKLQHAINELELDVTGLVVSFVITQALRHALTGHYPPLHLLQIDSPSHFKHEPWQRAFMLGWSLSLLLVSSFALPKLNELAASKGTLACNMAHMTKVILIMLIAWGFLLWGEWEFYENYFQGDIMFGHMVFAMIATLICLSVLYGMAMCLPRATSRAARETNTIATTGISLVAAWSWEHCFNLAFDIIGDEYQVGYEGLVPKVILSIIVPCALFPTYIAHVRTKVMEFDHAHEAHEEHSSEPASARRHSA